MVARPSPRGVDVFVHHSGLAGGGYRLVSEAARSRLGAGAGARRGGMMSRHGGATVTALGPLVARPRRRRRPGSGKQA